MDEYKKTKIAFFHLAFLYSGGGEKLALKEVQLLRDTGYDVDCYAPLIDSENCFPDTIKKYNIQEIFPKFSKYFKKKPEIGIMITCLLFPLIALKFKKYDLVIGANQPGPVFGWILKILLNKPYIIYLAQPTRMIFTRPIDKEHGYRMKNKIRFLPIIINVFRPIFYWVDLKTIRSADTFLCNGKYMQDILTQIYGRIPIVCAAGADTPLDNHDQKKFSALLQSRQKGHLSIKKYTIPKPFIFVSNRHFPHKKLEYALEVLDKLTHKIPLVIAGAPTEYTQELRSLIEYYKLEKYVYIIGYITEKQLKEVYKNCELYIYTAPEEDFGMGIVEAMGYGVPTFAWNNAGPSKIITPNFDGFLAKTSDTKEIAVTIEQIMTNPDTYATIAYNAINTIQSTYSWENHLLQFDATIQNLLKPDEAPAQAVDYLSETAL
jgi:glycosyltransferase involved in cell wall biosynthesis